jgi:hypothetical protein
MKPLHTGLLVAAIQVLIVAGVGGKYWIDRARYPHVWIETRPIDPDLPIRGRYLQLAVTVQLDPAAPGAPQFANQRVRLMVRDDQLVAVPDANGRHGIRMANCAGRPCWVLIEPLAFFMSEHAADPSQRAAGQNLWVEATIPPNGPPRPIRLGRRSDGAIVPITAD